MKRQIATRRRKKEKRIQLKWLVIAVILLLVGLSTFLLRTKYWNSEGKFAVVNKDYGGITVISLFDSKTDVQTDIVIPGNTQVLASYGLGTWKLQSLWELGINEKMGGSLITRTISKNFGFPIFIWWDKLSLGDKLRIRLFTLLNRERKEIIMLKETGFLKKTVFVDGESGYLVSNNVPEEVSSLFSDQQEFGNLLKAKILDSTGSYGISDKVGRIIETMGIKVASISKNSGMDGDCVISGKNKKLIKKIALILGCGESEVKDLNAFDLEINLGKKFTQRF